MINKTNSRRSGIVEATLDPDELVHQLCQPELYSDHPHSVEHIETHISHLFLTRRFAYKLKKPVRFEFLDFSTVDRRRAACLEELQLNRRLAPGVYLGVVPVTLGTDKTCQLGGEGPPVDWLVKMRRLPAKSALDVLLREQRLSRTATEKLAARLADFYGEAPPVIVAAEDYRLAIERHATANRDELLQACHHFNPAQVRRIHSGQLRVLRLLPDLLRNRCRDGRIIEGHGDLRPEHIYFTPSPVIIDCIEFNREFRTLDVVDELSFLAMECEMLEDREVAPTILRRYTEQTGDEPAPVLLDFYCAYRACVRAKVQSLRAEQLEGPSQAELLASARRYLTLAEQHVQRLGPPVVVLVRGLSGTGKSTLAKVMGDELGWELLSTDSLRHQLLGVGTGNNGFEQGRYRPENREQVYAQMHRLAEQMVREGTSVVLDGTYLSRAQRDAARELASNSGAALLDIGCECPTEIALERIQSRIRGGDSLSEARVDIHALQRARLETDAEGTETLTVDTTVGIAELWDQVLVALQKACFSDYQERP